MTGPRHSDVDRWFTPAPPLDVRERADAHESIRSLCRTLAHHLDDVLPVGVEKTEALVRLRDVMHWSHAAITCNGHERSSS